MATGIEAEDSVHRHSYIGLNSDPVEVEDKHLSYVKLGTDKPRGILAIHLKKCKLKTAMLETDVFSKRTPNAPAPNPSMYFKIHVGDDTKQTHIVPNMLSKSTHALDEIKHFPLTINTNRRDLSNRIVINLVGFEGKQDHRIIGKNELHLYDIIKNLFVAETYCLKRREKTIGTIDVEFCFAYGRFGYGYSSQLENTQKLPHDQIRHSMFFRPQPPTDRCMDDIDVLTCAPVGHPSYINFTQKAQIGNIGLDIGSEDTLRKCFFYEEPVLLMSKIRKGMTKLQRSYSELDSRQSRLKFLNDLVSSNADKTETESDKTAKTTGGAGPTPVSINVDDFDAKEGSSQEKTSKEEKRKELLSDLAEVKGLVQLAPGITARLDKVTSSQYAKLKITEKEEQERLERLRTAHEETTEEESPSDKSKESAGVSKVSKLLWMIDAFRPKKRVAPKTTESKTDEPENDAPAVNPFLDRLRMKRAMQTLKDDSKSEDEATLKSGLLAPPKLVLNPATPEHSGSESDVSDKD